MAIKVIYIAIFIILFLSTTQTPNQTYDQTQNVIIRSELSGSIHFDTTDKPKKIIGLFSTVDLFNIAVFVFILSNLLLFTYHVKGKPFLVAVFYQSNYFQNTSLIS